MSIVHSKDMVAAMDLVALHSLTDEQRNEIIDGVMNNDRNPPSKIAALNTAAKPLIDFVNTNCSPHDYVLVTQGSVHLLSGEIGLIFPTPD